MQQINNLQARISRYNESITSVMNRVILSGWWVMGPECRRFEELFAKYIGVKHCIGVANGTDAIELALKASGLTSGDLIATVANAGMYTTTAILALGASPFFMDVDIQSHCVSFAEIKRAVAAGVKAVVVTHLYGTVVPEIMQIAQYCKKHKVFLLEDCAQAHGAEIHNRKAGSFGDAASFSFYPTKNLGALGDGGAVMTNDDFIAEQVHCLKQYGWTAKYQVQRAGRNSRLDELQAAVLSEFLPYLDDTNGRRREIAARYQQQINHPHVIHPQQNGLGYVAHLYVIRCSQRDALKEHLFNANICSEIHYPIPDYRQSVFGDMFSSMYLENTEQLVSEILTLPCYPEIEDEAVNQIIVAVNGWH